MCYNLIIKFITKDTGGNYMKQNIMIDNIYVPALYVSWQLLKDKAVLLDERNLEVYELEDSAYDIFKYIILREYSVKQIIQKMCSKYSILYSEIEKDCLDFLCSLAEEELICLYE